MKYNGRIFTPLVAIFVIAAWHISYFFINYSESRAFLIGDGFLRYDFIYAPFILVFLWWLGKKYDEARFYSERDYLTGLYNRRFVWAKFPGMLERASRSKQELRIFLVDIDSFKMINDTCGHEIGDEVVQGVSAALLRNTMPSCMVARWGGDEFLIITSQLKDKSPDTLVRMIERTLQSLSRDVGREITVSIGDAIYPIDARSPNELIRIADQRMYTHKVRHLLDSV